jgi:hypothetical protein
MKYFIETLKLRNEALFYFGVVCFLFALLCLVLTKYSPVQVMGVSAWYKPFKFALSTAIFSWSMGWYCFYLKSPLNVTLFNWAVIVLLAFEIIYIAYRAAKGQLSHFNISSSFAASMYSLMAAAATIVTLWTAYMGILFFKADLHELPDYYVWSIRLGIILFVIFSFEGFVMGGRLSHTFGGADGSPGIPILNWSKTLGDGRVAHFFGMHALQLLPLVSFYLLKNIKLTFAVAILYGFLSLLVLVNALNGKPFIK